MLGAKGDTFLLLLFVLALLLLTRVHGARVRVQLRARLRAREREIVRDVFCMPRLEAHRRGAATGNGRDAAISAAR
jgi:hypothetical protein